MTDTARDILLSRWFDARIDSVWSAFTDPAELAKWYGPAGVEVDPASVQLGDAPGGPWALIMVAGDRRMSLSGTITELEPLCKLVVTDAMPDGSTVTMTVELSEENGGTRLTLRQGPFPASAADGAEAAWGQAADKLATLLES
jgi:uncharacterized protein YndB with AHSA1/START domain